MNGAFSVKGSGSVTGSGVMFFIDPNGSFSLTGSGAISLSPLTSGIYQGMTLFQSRSNTSTVSITGNGSFNLAGTFYAPKALVQVSGNGDVLGSQFIADQLQNKGAGNSGGFSVNYNGTNAARTRVLGLVE
jgi:hypothetical protein